jgi:hypothetical protein
MPVTATHLTTSGSDSSLSSYATASISPTANRLVLLAVTSNFTATPNQPTVSGAGLTWVVVATKLDSDPSRRVTVFRALSASPSSGVLTIDFAGQGQSRCSWSVSEFANVDRTGTNGSNAIVQSASNTNQGTTASGITVTLGAFGNANNATYGAVRTGSPLAITPGSGFTELGEFDGSATTIETEWKNSNDTSVDWSWASSSPVVIAIAVEIKYADPAVADAGAAAFFM